MSLQLGIDTGGTYTDVVLLDAERRVRAAAKALTTHDDLARGIATALQDVLADTTERIDLVSLSTTLATNALVEGQGSPVGLVLVGQPREFLQRGGLGEALGGDPVVLLAGGHDAAGSERAPLDPDAARVEIERHAPKVAAFAVSSFFATRNPAHERRLQRLIHEWTGKPVSTGHELSAALDAPRRALTALLNARLIALLTDLISAVQTLLSRHAITAPLMVVRGDGSLMSAEFAATSPVETILSGPAASLVGARALAGTDNAVVLDIGGTTSDIGVLEHGEPGRTHEGAVVGGWRTRVAAVEVHTYGIGGDSAVRLQREREHPLRLGPDRVIPLSLLATEHPWVVQVLAEQASEQPLREHAGWFVRRRRAPVGGVESLSSAQRLLWERLADGPVDLVRLFEDQTRARALSRLVERGVVALSGFTPSDAAHVLGTHGAWSGDAARAGATIGARQACEHYGRDFADADEFAVAVRRTLEEDIARATLAASLADTRLAPAGILEPGARALVDDAIGACRAHPRVAVAMSLRQPLIVLGAPAATYGEAIARRLGTTAIVSAQAHVANAIGAVAAGVVQRVVATILPLADERFRVHAPDGVSTFATLDEARDWAARDTERLASARAEAAGAAEVEVEIKREETLGHSDTGDVVFFQATVTAIARGRPRIGGERGTGTPDADAAEAPE